MGIYGSGRRSRNQKESIHAIVQDCLNAHREEEITAKVFEEHANEIFDEAENRLHAQKAVMVLLMGNKD